MHYQIETKYWRRAVPNIHDESHNETPTKADLVETKKEFHHVSPIEARKQVFQHYGSILDVLYSGLGISQTTDKQARIDLQQYFDSGNGIEYLSKYPEKKFKINSVDMHNRIAIYMVVNGVKTVIHSMRYLDYADRLDYDLLEDLEGLVLEYNQYLENDYASEGYEINVDFTAIGGTVETFIKTPVSWKELVNEYTGLELIS
ncbi:hypothetical protein FG167_16515 [Lacinutrix sp. WUR7]|uniref:hypothetical protein n=1 Tax=Lacinutrix sp. WUR7 TaxID=2653681 RepID=UPI00193D0E16|nr:hypothetical protein [Lacinutrix sp. WUR7]QRM90774.1 hypothetical protein FG167_16515 [Lacinutrix sp. WUR7]